MDSGGLRVLALAIGCVLAASAAASEPPSSPAAAPPHPPPAHAPQSESGYSIGPAPSWVVPAKERDGARVESAPMHYRVVDEQTRLSGKSETDYIHVVRVVNEAAGLGAAARIEIEFDPSFQKLTLHHLDLVREGRHASRLTKRYPLLRRETRLERQMYDGRQTLSIVVEDVRVGDEIDYAFSLSGSNPVFDGKFVRALWMRNARGPEALHQVRLLTPLGRDIHYRTPPEDVQVTTRTLGNFRETVFRRESIPRLAVDLQSPPSALLAEQLQFSEFNGWSDVARWGAELFAPAPGGPLLDREADEIRARAATPSAQLLAALDFVQKEIRYFGTEIGASTHRPAAPERVIRQRFGDCKDKVALVLSLLARLNIPATPVLVSASLRAQAFELLPGPLDFDHVIARVELEGSTYWIDATRSHQSGELSQRQPLGLGEGLPLTSDTSAPVPLPNAYDSERLLVNDIIRFKMIRDDPTLESRVTFRGDLAEGLRESLATKSTSEIAAQVSAPYLKTYPKARTTGALQIESSSVDDAVTLVQTFVIADFWRLPEPQATLVSQVVPYAVVEALTFPRMEMRRQPLLFPLTGIIRHSIVIEYPENVYWQAPAARFEDGDAYLTLRERVQGTPRRMEYSSELRINSDQVAPEDWPAFAAKVDELDHKLGFNVSIPPIPLEQVDEVTRKLKAAAEHEPHVSGEGADSLSPAKRIMLAAEIDGGRLPPHLEAQVRAERGAFDDQEGLAAQAAADFRRALELFPESAEVLHGAALNALQLQQLDRAIDLASTALQLSAHDEISLETRARARYLKKDLAGARADLEEMLKNPDSVRRGYPLVWLGFTLRQSAQEGASATTAYASGLPTEWPRPLIDLAANRTDPQSVLTAARARKNSAQSLCEAYFYIGEDYYTRGNLEQARRSWQKATEQGAAGPVEDGAARLRLQSVLGK